MRRDWSTLLKGIESWRKRARWVQCKLKAVPTAIRVAVVCIAILYRPELTLTRQRSCIESASRVADVVVWGGGAIRDDIGSEELRRRARRERDGRVSARLIALANALEGMDRASAARLAGMDRQTLRDWVHRYNAEGIAGLCNRSAPGRKPKLTEGQMATLKAVVLAGPDPAVDKIARWRIVDLCQLVEERWGVSYSETGMLRLLWSLDLSHRKTRPRHPQSSEKAQQAFKKRGLLAA
jgi:transposase